MQCHRLGSGTSARITRLAGVGVDTSALDAAADVITSTSDCEESDFAEFTAGDIALPQRGTCSFYLKAANDEAADATGVIIFNELTMLA